MSAEATSPIPVIQPKFAVIAAAANKFPGVDITALETGITMLSVMSELFAAYDLHYARHGLSRGRFLVLAVLAQENGGGLSPAELADRARVTRATMTGLIDTLSHAGLVERVDDPSDRRMYRVFLTDKGRSTLEEMLPDHFRRMTGLLQHLSGEERHQLCGLLEKVRKGIDTIRIE